MYFPIWNIGSLLKLYDLGSPHVMNDFHVISLNKASPAVENLHSPSANRPKPSLHVATAIDLFQPTMMALPVFAPKTFITSL